MNYQVIARRYRPRRFEEVVGQESVAVTLRAGILQDRVAHAYLFGGPRGVGKTSMARIFAKALNCPQAADRTRNAEDWARPCDACTTCEAIHLGQDIDVAELDGASHRGIEDVRSIVESVNRPATRSRYKIFIIDEVHMLTREAFNALLKTIEEPPAHVKFIFATTEPHRIPETVLSRCQRFDFQPINAEAIVRRLSQILAMEGREAEEGLLESIARYGKGGLRDAQTLLDQLMTFTPGKLSVEDLERITGRAPESIIEELGAAALAGDPAAVLERLRDCFQRGADPALLLDQLMDSYRRRVHDMVGAMAAPKGTVAAATQPVGASGGSLDRLIGSIQILLEAASKLRYSPLPELAVEIVLLKLARLEEPAALEEVLRALAELEEGPREALAPPPAPALKERGGQSPAWKSSATFAPPAAPPASPTAASRPSESSRSLDSSRPLEAGAPAAADAGLDFRRLIELWDQIRIELEAKHPDMAPFFKQVMPELAGGSRDTAVLCFPDEFFCRQMKLPRKQSAFEDLAREVTKAPWKFRMEHGSPRGAPFSSGAPSSSGIPSAPGAPSSPKDRAPAGAGEDSAPGKASSPRRGAGEGISQHPLVKKSVDLFKGRLV